MKILIINQPHSNYGDLAAHRSLVRSLETAFPEAQISVLFLAANSENIEKMNVTRASYITLSGHGGRFVKIAKMVFFLNSFRFFSKAIWALSAFYPDIKKTITKVKDADYVISAPGGICMGSFQSWSHIFFLEIATHCRKKIAYYSRSWGPFPDHDFWQKKFKKVSLNLLRSFDFHSIRDAKTMKIADKLGLSYIPAIDTVFLDQPRTKVPQEILSWIDESPYTIFVPNTLVWHREYRTASIQTIRTFYLDIIRLLLKDRPHEKILMLPQLYARGISGDETYFRELEQELNDDRVFVVSDKHCSDVQQTIISKARLVIGARYHSIVFALNNCVPFISLSYEHKMTGLLEILGKMDCSVDITSFARNAFDSDKSLAKIALLINSVEPDSVAREKAHQIAQHCMDELIKKMDETNVSNT